MNKKLEELFDKEFVTNTQPNENGGYFKRWKRVPSITTIKSFIDEDFIAKYDHIQHCNKLYTKQQVLDIIGEDKSPIDFRDCYNQAKAEIREKLK